MPTTFHNDILANSPREWETFGMNWLSGRVSKTSRHCQGAREIVVIHLAMRGSIRTMSSAAKIRSRVACTESVRVEFLRYKPQPTGQWNVARPPLYHPDGEHSDLAIGDLAHEADVLTADATGRAALLEEANLVDEQNRIIIRPVLDDMVTHDVTQRIRVPLATAKDSLLPPSPVTSSLCAHICGVAALIVYRPGTNLPALLSVPA
jgi:hypothetical protein